MSAFRCLGVGTLASREMSASMWLAGVGSESEFAEGMEYVPLFCCVYVLHPVSWPEWCCGKGPGAGWPGVWAMLI